MNSPTQQYGPARPGSTSPYFQIALYAGGQVLAVAILLLVWFSWGILAAFQEPLLWAWLCSLSLRDVKRFLVSTARRELLTSSFIICCAKLVFLPAVIAWQLLEEVRDNLQAKYCELQASSQATAAADAARFSSMALPSGWSSSLPLPDEGGDTNNHNHSSSDGHPASSQPTAAGSAQAGQQDCRAKGSQVLRQRKTAGKQQQQQQQQQQNRNQRPPLGPRGAAATSGSSNAPGRQSAAAAAARGSSGWHRRRQQQQAGRAARAPSPLQQRVARLQEFFRQLFNGYGFIIKELLRLVLGGLLPRHSESAAAADYQNQQQQQQLYYQYQQQQQQQWIQQHRQHTWPNAVGGGNATLPALGYPVGAHVPYMSALHATDLVSSAGSHPASITGSMGDSFNGSCRSECNMPWTPHPQWQQLLQQQQQQYPQQAQMPLPLQQQQHQQQQARGLSSSCSSPSLHTASRQVSPMAAHVPSAVAAMAGADSVAAAGAERTSTLPGTVTSFSGWAAVPAQQQQQQQQLSRCDSGKAGSATGVMQMMARSSSSSADSIATAAATAGAAAAAVMQPQQQQSQSQQQSQTSAGASSSVFQVHPPPPGLSFSLPSQLPAPVASGNGSMHQQQQQQGVESLPQQQQQGGPPPGGFDTGSLQSGYWEGVALGVLAPGGRTPPASVTGMAVGGGGAAAGGGDRSNPSAVLFKGLMRGIVLYEGYRFVRGFLAAEQSLFMPLLLLGATLAVAGGLPFLLLPASLLHPSTAAAATTAAATATQDQDETAPPSSPKQQQGGSHGTAEQQPGLDGPTASKQLQMHSPFSEAAAAAANATVSSTDADIAPASAAATAAHQPRLGSSSSGAVSTGLARGWGLLQRASAAGWSWLVAMLSRVDTSLRMACASSFLDTAVSGLIVVGLILGSVVLSAVLLVQIGDESRQAVVSLNSLVRQKGTEAGLTEGVWSLVQQYEGQLVGMTQYVLQETLPGLTLYVETRASDFLISHNLSKVLIDWEVVRAALKLPADCGEEARLRLAVQLANSSLAEASLGRQKQHLQQQLDSNQQQLAQLAHQLEAAWINGSSSSNNVSANSNSNSSNSSVVARGVLQVQEAVARLQEDLQNVTAAYEGVSEQLKLAELRLHNCQPTAGSPAAAAAGLADAAKGRGLLSNLLGGFAAGKHAQAGTASSSSAAGRAGASGKDGSTAAAAQHPLSHVKGVLAALTRLDFAAAGNEAAAVLGQLMSDGEEEDSDMLLLESLQDEEEDEGQLEGLQDQQQQQAGWGHGRQLQRVNSCGLVEVEGEGSGVDGSSEEQQQQTQQQLPMQPASEPTQCPLNHTCAAAPSLNDAVDAAAAAATAAAADSARQLARSNSKKTVGGGSSDGSSSSSLVVSSGSSGGSRGNSTSSSSASTSLMRVARGAAYPLITMLRHVSSVVAAGLGSTTAVALGTGLGVLRLGLGVAKFLVQLGVFASVLYTLLALDIDPVEHLLKLLPISEASQDRASRAVTKALRGVFVSSLKLAAFHAGFTWLTLRAFGTHFCVLSTVASAVVAVLPLVPVYLAAMPAVLELLVRGSPVKGLVLLGLHVGAYTFGDDLIYREIEPTLPYLVGLGVFGGMWHFANPLQGVLLGPMVLALLSVGYNLHRELY